jgi:hypothetical protein
MNWRWAPAVGLIGLASTGALAIAAVIPGDFGRTGSELVATERPTSTAGQTPKAVDPTGSDGPSARAFGPASSTAPPDFGQRGFTPRLEREEEPLAAAPELPPVPAGTPGLLRPDGRDPPRLPPPAGYLMGVGTATAAPSAVAPQVEVAD